MSAAATGLWADPVLLELFTRELGTLMERLEALGVALGEGGGGGTLAEARRVLHTVKGSCATMGFEGMSQLAHALEDALGEGRAGEPGVAAALGELVLEARDHLAAMARSGPDAPAPADLLARLAEEIVPQRRPGTTARGTLDGGGAPRLDVVEVPVGELEALFTLAESCRAEHLAGKRGADVRLAELGRRLLAARQTRLARLGPKLRRVVLETSRQLDRPAELVIEGDDLHAEVPVALDLAATLPHLLRNALDHGLEPADERARLGKPAVGCLTLRFAEEGNALVVTLTDDGRGFDPAAITRAAVARGVVDAEEAARLTHDERLRLILAPGFSTRPDVSAVSGRGVGLDVVTSAITRRGGRIELDGTPGLGARFELRLPIGSRWDEMLLVEIGAGTYGVPVRAVAEIVPDADDRPAPGVTRGLVFSGDEVLPVIGIAALDPRFGHEIRRPLLVLELGGARLAMAVDRLVGFAGALVQGLPGTHGPPWLAGIARFAGDGVVWSLDLGEVGRHWNAYTIPEELPP